jgi:histidyl-tRNA synthetase
MVDTSPINRVKGTKDVLSADYHERAYLKQRLLDFLRRYGYMPVDTPVLEHSELYLRKSGEDIISRMYDFHYQSRRLCLRPEMTASIIRAYIDHMQEQPLPVRLCYSGQVFRYERPQQARYRQFTEVGAELIGARAVPDDDSPDPDVPPGVLADAELISIPCKALEDIGLPDYRLVIGDVGILLTFLRQIGLKGQMQNVLMLNMEKFRTEGVDEFTERIREINPQFEYNGYSGESDDESAAPVSRLTGILREMSEDDAREAVSDFLSSLNLRVDSTRDDVEIIDRLVTKIKQEDDIPRLNRAVSFMAELSDLQGAPDDVLARAREVLAAHHVEMNAIDRLETLIEYLGHYGIPAENITLDLALSRGLQYYTGTVFEIHHGSAAENKDEHQVCGGGRYDDLIQVLGGRQSLDAIGFSFGLERLQLALRAQNKLPDDTDTQPQILLVNISTDDMPYTLQVADMLREKNVRVELAVRDRSVRNHLHYADKRGIPYVMLIGEDERTNESVTLRDMSAHDETEITLTDIDDALQQRGILA